MKIDNKPSVAVDPLPTPERERSQILDILRGFALFGILLVNMEDFSALPGGGVAWNSGADRTVAFTLRLAAEGKFRACFAFLFGIGFALQLQRAQERGFTARYLRRIGALLIIGLAHYVFLWDSDILTNYAIVGLLLLPFTSRPASSSVRAGAALVCVSTLLFTLIVLFAHPRQRSSTVVVSSDPAAAAVYSKGSYGQVVSYRLDKIGLQIGRIVGYAPLTLMVFLFGLAAGKSGIVQNPEAHRMQLRRVCVIGIALGVSASTAVAIYAADLMSLPRIPRVLVAIGYVVGGPVLGIAYLAGLTLLLLDTRWQRRLTFLAGIGRMALTNYLMQSVICTTLFYGYGFGWYNKISPLNSIGMCFVIFGVQAVGSMLWLRKFRYGPFEWLWRSVTYMRRLRISGAPSPQA